MAKSYLLASKGRKAADDIKSPDCKAILQWMKEGHNPTNADEVKLMTGVNNAAAELDSMVRAGLLTSEDEDGGVNLLNYMSHK